MGIRKVTPELHEKILKLYREHKTLREIADLCDVSTTTVCLDIPKAEKRVNGYKILPEMQREIFCLYNIDDVSIKDIAAQFKIPLPSVRRHAAAYHKFNMKGEDINEDRI